MNNNIHISQNRNELPKWYTGIYTSFTVKTRCVGLYLSAMLQLGVKFMRTLWKLIDCKGRLENVKIPLKLQYTIIFIYKRESHKSHHTDADAFDKIKSNHTHTHIRTHKSVRTDCAVCWKQYPFIMLHVQNTTTLKCNQLHNLQHLLLHGLWMWI